MKLGLTVDEMLADQESFGGAGWDTPNVSTPPPTSSGSSIDFNKLLNTAGNVAAKYLDYKVQQDINKTKLKTVQANPYAVYSPSGQIQPGQYGQYPTVSGQISATDNSLLYIGGAALLALLLLR